MSAMAKKEERTAWLFIALPFLGFLLFMAYPICFAVFASMSKWTGMNSLVDNFCGLQNYINIFHDEKFWKSLLTQQSHPPESDPALPVLLLLQWLLPDPEE